MRASRIILLAVISVSMASCRKAAEPFHEDGLVSVELSFDNISSTKTLYAGNGKASWYIKDMIAVCASYDGNTNFTDTYFHQFKIPTGDEHNPSATFSGQLTDKGSHEYTYYSIYPYTSFLNSSNVSALELYLAQRQFPLKDNWDGTCDFLVGKPLSVYAPSVAAIYPLEIQTRRIFGFLKISFMESLLRSYGNETLEEIIITASRGDALTGKFSMDITSGNTAPTFVGQESYNSLILDYQGKGFKLKDVVPYGILKAGQYDLSINIKTDQHSLSFDRAGVPVSCGDIVNVKLNRKPGDGTNSNAPVLPKNPESLNIFTFGHSLCADSYSHLNAMIRAAGIENVTIGMVMIGGCPLEKWWEMTESGASDIEFMYKDQKRNDWQIIYGTVDDALRFRDWDIVVFQTGLSQEGHYEMFNPYLTNLKNHVETLFGRKPIYAWHMFWPYADIPGSTMLKEHYDGNQDMNYAAHVQAAREVMAKDGMQFVIPTGTAVQSVRNSSLNNVYDLGRDAVHMDTGVGQYIAGAVWFETFIKPCYGVSIMDNTYIPSDYTYMPVTADNVIYLKRAAVNAVERKFQTSSIEKLIKADNSLDNYDSFDPVNY